MNLIKRNSNLILPSLLDEIFKPDWNGGIQNFNTSVPAVNIRESETGFALELFAPGLKKEDFNIEIEQRTLSISSEIQKEAMEDNEIYSRKEYSIKSFRRSFNLPETVNFDAIEANYENGILHLHLPKREEALPKPKRVIEIA